VLRATRPFALGRGAHLARHLVEMTLAMAIGMMVGATAFFSAAGTTPDDGLRRYAISFTLVMVAAMTIPMVAWMRYRGHTWRSSAEMTLAMALPALPLIGLRAGHLIAGSICGFYCLASFAAMVALVVYRRRDRRAAAG